MSGRVSRAKTFSGRATHRAMRSGDLQGQRLGDQLAEDDVHERDERGRRGRRRRSALASDVPRAGQAVEQRLEQVGPGPARRPSPGAMLASVMPSCVAAMERSRCVIADRPPWHAGTPLAHHLLDCGSAHRDKGELGGDEEAVEGDQRRDGQCSRDPDKSQSQRRWSSMSAFYRA